jgi:uncharacterized RDD family membrane protein YckC
VVAASLGRRVIALAIDWIASTGVVLVFLGAAAYLTTEGSLTILGVFYLEIVLLTWLLMGSFGQLIVGLRVVDLAGQRLAFWRIAVRTALICLVIPAVVQDNQGRGLHDRLVGSIVIASRQR